MYVNYTILTDAPQNIQGTAQKEFENLKVDTGNKLEINSQKIIYTFPTFTDLPTFHFTKSDSQCPPPPPRKNT